MEPGGREIDFQEADRRYAELKRQWEAGALDAEDFDAQLKQMMVRDDRGVWWAKSRKTGDWHYHDGRAWVRGTPPSYRTTTQVSPTPEFFDQRIDQILLARWVWITAAYVLLVGIYGAWWFTGFDSWLEQTPSRYTFRPDEWWEDIGEGFWNTPVLETLLFLFSPFVVSFALAFDAGRSSLSPGLAVGRAVVASLLCYVVFIATSLLIFADYFYVPSSVAIWTAVLIGIISAGVAFVGLVWGRTYGGALR